FFGFLGGSRSYLPQPDDRLTPGTQMYLNEVKFPETGLSYLTDDLAEAAAEFIRETLPYPWMLYVSFNAVHTPLENSPGEVDPYQLLEPRERREYAGMLTALDRGVGKIL